MDVATLIERARSLGADQLPSLVAEADQRGEFPKAAVGHLRTSGLMGLAVPSEFGGAGGQPRDFARVVEILAEADASTTMIYIMHVAAGKSIENSGVGVRDATLRAIASGEHLSTLAASERGSRSLFWLPVSQLSVAAQGYSVSAHKSWVTSAHHANSFVATAQSPGADSPMNSVLFLAFPGREGVAIQKEFDGLGLRANDAAPIVLSDYRVAADELICETGKGFEHLLGVVLPWFLVGTTALSVGLCRAAVSATQAHLGGAKFEHDGSRLADLPNLRAALAKMSTTADAAGALLDRALTALEGGEATATLLLLEARLFAIGAAVDVCDAAMRCGGGAAFSKHTPLERVFRDSLAGRVMAPTTDHLHDLIGKALLGMDLF